ncbi:MAG: hypothetical protein JNG89_21760 [Planctomycetaceae bacterium]|nr:hypothetical protein [Planctomycetaceae bacterium]
MASRQLFGGLASLLVLGLAGCGSNEGAIDKVPVYPATGVVRMDGKPFGPVVVELAPVDRDSNSKARTVMGTADAQGKVVFGTYGIDDGAAAGEYKVVIRSSLSAPPPGPIPTRYGSFTSTPLTASISPDRPNEVAVDLQVSGSKGPGGTDVFTEATKSEAFRAGTGTSTTE